MICYAIAITIMFKNGLYTHFYRPKTKLPEDNVFTPVCDSVHGGGGGGGVNPQGRHPTRQTSPSEMGIEVGGTHPTGMHCCFECDSYLSYRKESQSRNKSYM